MKRIIAGGTGFIGRHLVPHWLEQGIEVSVIGRDKNKINRLFQNKVKALDWDDIDKLDPDAFHKTEVIVNLNGATIGDKRWTEQRKQEILDSRIKPTTRLAELCAKLGDKSPALFNANAIGIYGLQEPSKELPPAYDEATEIDYANAPDFLSLVGRKWEQASLVAKAHGVRVVNLRFAVVLSNDGGALPRIAFPFYFFMGGPINSGNQVFCWISLDDLLVAIDFLIPLQDVSGPVNLVAPECIQQKQFAKTLGKVLQKPSCFPTPGFLLKLGFGEMAEELLLKGQHVKPKRLQELGFKFNYPTLESALRHIYNKE